ncbi:MAG: dihydroxyacetone kinase subunit DhaL, partial [Litoreibacter sp.]
EIGMGIHGEPGVERGPAASADEVADKLLAPILEELALGSGDKVAVLVNGLGSTSLLELYILHRRVAQVLDGQGVVIHNSWVGEYCTSLDMEGASITLMKLDDGLQTWLDHPCETPALKVGEHTERAAPTIRTPRAKAQKTARTVVDRGSLKTDGDITPDIFRKMMAASVSVIQTERDHLNALDGAIGDGDHGLTMEMGWKAVQSVLEESDESTTITELCDDIAEAFLETVGASAGPLYSSGFRAAGAAVSDRLNLDAQALASLIAGMSAGIRERGGASVGQKTMLDAWGPAGDAALGSLASSSACLNAAAKAASNGALGTKDMLSQMGRSKKLGERSRGHIDPGAASAAMLLKAWAEVIS